MSKYLEVFQNEFIGTFNWVLSLILFQVSWYQNYFWGLLLISILIWFLEVFFPWRKNQAVFRKDFWLDLFYMYFNFFIFSILITGFYAVIQFSFSQFGISISSIALLDISEFHISAQLFVFFILLDFVQWFTHILLHRFHFLWKFHKVHHSVQEMGFAAHLRYHWMENVLYKPLKTLAVMLLGGFEPEMAYIVHFLSITIGHLNHANLKITWGPLRYIFNNPVMHLWHHAKTLPPKRRWGVNFGISLSIWDYIFGTNYVPEDSGNIALGFEGVEEFPSKFTDQFVYGFGTSRKK